MLIEKIVFDESVHLTNGESMTVSYDDSGAVTSITAKGSEVPFCSCSTFMSTIYFRWSGNIKMRAPLTNENEPCSYWVEDSSGPTSPRVFADSYPVTIQEFRVGCSDRLLKCAIGDHVFFEFDLGLSSEPDSIVISRPPELVFS